VDRISCLSNSEKVTKGDGFVGRESQLHASGPELTFGERGLENKRWSWIDYVSIR